jgi:hypothetical protein
MGVRLTYVAGACTQGYVEETVAKYIDPSQPPHSWPFMDLLDSVAGMVCPPADVPVARELSASNDVVVTEFSPVLIRINFMSNSHRMALARAIVEDSPMPEYEHDYPITLRIKASPPPGRTDAVPVPTSSIILCGACSGTLMISDLAFSCNCVRLPFADTKGVLSLAIYVILTVTCRGDTGDRYFGKAKRMACSVWFAACSCDLRAAKALCCTIRRRGCKSTWLAPSWWRISCTSGRISISDSAPKVCRNRSLVHLDSSPSALPESQHFWFITMQSRSDRSKFLPRKKDLPAQVRPHFL